MQIYIDSIDTTLSTQSGQSGYRIRFRSELSCGTAILAATDHVNPTLQDQEIFVEVEAQSFLPVRVLLADELKQYRFDALPQEGNYQVVGTVEYILADEDAEAVQVDVRVGDALVHGISHSLSSLPLAVGDWVNFTIVGLILWDMHL